MIERNEVMHTGHESRIFYWSFFAEFKRLGLSSIDAARIWCWVDLFPNFCYAYYEKDEVKVVFPPALAVRKYAQLPRN